MAYQTLSSWLQVEQGRNSTNEVVQPAYRKWVENSLSNAGKIRDDKWAGSVAVGSERFTQKIEVLMGSMALGRESLESRKSFQLRESQVPYSALFEDQKDEIALRNSYFWY